MIRTRHSVHRTLLTTATALAALTMTFGGAAAANATEQSPPYVIVLWEKPADTFGPQHVVASSPTSSTDINALDSSTVPGTCYQADLYANDATTDALIAGGVLTAPGQPTESWPGGYYTPSFSKTWCTEVPPTDYCPDEVLNPGVQPEGTVCVLSPVDVCPDVDGVQTDYPYPESQCFPLIPPVVECGEGTVLNPDTQNCDVIVVPPTVTPPPVAVAAVQAQPELASTGPVTTWLLPWAIGAIAIPTLIKVVRVRRTRSL